MPKYGLLRQRVEQAALPGVTLMEAQPASDEQIALAHDREYLLRVVEGRLSEKEMRRIGFPWTPQLVLRSRYSVGGTICAGRAALEDNFSANLAGGTHHAHADHGEGYCVFNDVAVAVRVLQKEGRISRAVVLDLDVHQGNGTAAIFKDDPTVFTLSLHGEKNFPFRKERSDLDIALPDGCGDEPFLEAVKQGVTLAIERAHADLAFYIAGADPYEGDRLGRLKVTKEGLLERDYLVFELCRRFELPVAIVLGGGYARQVEDTVEIHLATIRLAAEYARRVGGG